MRTYMLLVLVAVSFGLATISEGEQGFEAWLSAEFVGSYDWSAGVFNGRIPTRQFVDLSAGYRVNNSVRVHLTATNVLDQPRFLIYGGSVIGRRVLGAVTVTF